MKKLVVFILILAMCGLTAFVKMGELPLLSCEQVTKVCFVVDNDSEITSQNVTLCGTKKFVYLSRESALSYAKSGVKVDAVQFYLDEDFPFQTLKEMLSLSVIETQVLGEVEIVYGYSPYYQDCVYVENKKVNVQVVLKSGEVVVGFPLILTGY